MNAQFTIFDVVLGLVNLALGGRTLLFAPTPIRLMGLINIACAAFMFWMAILARRRAYECLSPNPILKSLHLRPNSGVSAALNEKSPYHLRWFPWPRLYPNAKRSRLNLKAPVVGYRLWVLGWPSGQLESIGGDYAWTAGVNTAKCSIYDHDYGWFTNILMHGFRKHRAPERDCTCGLYAMHEPTLANMSGVVQAWGRIERHGQEGFRAEYARIIALFGPLPGDPSMPVYASLAEKYGVPLIPFQEAKRFAKDYGISLAP